MSERGTTTALARVEQTARLALEIRAMVERTRLIIENSREILSAPAARGGPAPPSAHRRPATAAPDALCAAFDALLEAARQAEDCDDPRLFALVERALLHAGHRIEQTASTLGRDEPPLQ